MASEALPGEFDVIVLGTGLPESLVSASLSRIGKKVLHLDRNTYYGSSWATHSLKSLLEWSQEITKEDIETICESSGETENNVDSDGIRLASHDRSVTNVKIQRLVKLTSEIGSNEQSSDTKDMGIDESSENRDVAVDQMSTKDETGNGTSVQEEGTESHALSNEGMIVEENNITTSEEQNTAVAAAVEGISSQAKLVTGSPLITFEDLQSQSRKFNLDLSPKLLFARGQFVETLINANITHYAEFKNAYRILTYRDDSIVDVPCSRADVFGSTFVSVLEKRVLMKFLTFCLTYQDHPDEYEEYKDKDFLEFLKSKKLTEKLQFFVITAIAMVPKDANTMRGLQATQNFLRSLGRYSNSPFLWPMYGVGELPQAFCRMSAVFGGVFCLRKSIRILSVNKDSDNYTAITSEGENISTKWLVLNQSYLSEEQTIGQKTFTSRAIIIANRTIKTADTEKITLLSLESERGPVLGVEVGPASCGCPVGLFVMNLFCQAKGSAEEDLSQYVERLYDTSGKIDKDGSKPCVLWCIYFNQESTPSSTNYRVNGLPDNVLITSYPDAELGVDSVIDEAKEIFHTICPGEEFLRAIPNPEDIIWDDVREGVENHGGFDEASQEQEWPAEGDEQVQSQEEQEHPEEESINDGVSNQEQPRVEDMDMESSSGRVAEENLQEVSSDVCQQKQQEEKAA